MLIDRTKNDMIYASRTQNSGFSWHQATPVKYEDLEVKTIDYTII